MARENRDLAASRRDARHSRRRAGAEYDHITAPQLPPRGTPLASAIVWMDPSDMSICFTLPSAKNPSQRPSGDQNGSNPFSVAGQRTRA